MEKTALIEQIDDLLPQTQCRQCGFPGCKPYAAGIARGEADINQCPPGGEEGMMALAALLGVEPKPLDISRGRSIPKSVAMIDEARCVGCTLCIQACPVDAILGAAKFMHTVLAEECTGCRLCLTPCPVDCIKMNAVEHSDEAFAPQRSARQQADQARSRYQARLKRIAQENLDKLDSARRKKESLMSTSRKPPISGSVQ